MRIINREAADGDLMNFIIGQTAKPSFAELLYEKWIKQVWLPTLLKTDPGLAFPVQVNDPSSLVKGALLKPSMFVELPRIGKMRIHEVGPYDLKDAQRGILYYYEPTQTTLASYRQPLSGIRDYLLQDLFADKESDYDVRKHVVANVEVASEKWHAEMVARLQRQLQEQRKETARLSMQPGRDTLLVTDFVLNGKEYQLVRLMTRASLTYESSIMNHCVYSYGLRLYDQRCVLLSIRAKDKADHPLVTIELDLPDDLLMSPTLVWQHRIVQIRGPYNSDANTMIPGIVEKMARLVGSCGRKNFAPLRDPDVLTFKVSMGN